MSDINFSRNTKLFLGKGSDVWEVPIMDGYSFSQATNTSEITLNEMAKVVGSVETSRRGRAMFTDSLAPAEWSFASYVRPNGVTTIDEALWANFIADNTYTSGTATWAKGVSRTGGFTSFDFEDSNVTTLGTFDLYFVLGGCGTANTNATPTTKGTYDFTGLTTYKLPASVVNNCTIDFDIEGIAMITWGGFSGTIVEEADFQVTDAIRVGVDSTSNFIRNRLTTLDVQAADTTAFPGLTATPGKYLLTLTGGSITFENNISYLIPEELCKVNKPIEHVTGTRTISGNFTCYLDQSEGGTEDLFEDMTSTAALGKVRNSFDLLFKVGGAAGTNRPNMELSFPKAHLEIPTHSLEDVISVDVNFHAHGTDISSADEAVITYKPAT